MLTMRDIAAHVGVSVSAVSLVLSGNGEGRVNAEKSALIRSAAKDMGYVPNQLARSLRSKQTLTIGLVTDEAASVPFSGRLIGGAEQAAARQGYLLMVIDTGGHDELQGKATRSLLQRNIDALIFATAYHKVIDLPTVPESVPVVVSDGRPSEASGPADYVVPDEQGGSRDAVRLLVQAGHSRIGFCNVPDAYPIAAGLRSAGYRDALSEVGLQADPRLTLSLPDAGTVGALRHAVELLSSSNRPTAVFCFSDQIAFAFYQAAHRLGLRVPEDLSIVGFDNQDYVAEALDPGLTTVQLPHSDMGAWAAERALSRISGELEGTPASGALFPCPVVHRASVAAPPN